MDPLKCQNSTASPAEPGNFRFCWSAGRRRNRQSVSDET